MDKFKIKSFDEFFNMASNSVANRKIPIIEVDPSLYLFSIPRAVMHHANISYYIGDTPIIHSKINEDEYNKITKKLEEIYRIILKLRTTKNFEDSFWNESCLKEE